MLSDAYMRGYDKGFEDANRKQGQWGYWGCALIGALCGLFWHLMLNAVIWLIGVL